MRNIDIQKAKKSLELLNPDNKFETMIHVSSVITQCLDSFDIKPVIVGGLSVDIYTKGDYATRDIDFVSDGYEKINSVLSELGFIKDNRHFLHKDLEVAVEIPSNQLAGDFERINKIEIDKDHFVYVISLEDIIIDRLRAFVNWTSAEDGYWGFLLLSSNYPSIDIPYLKSCVETKKEEIVLNDWFKKLS